MHRPALLTLALLLAAGAAQAAPAAGKGDMSWIQGDWKLPGRSGQVLTVSGGSARLSAVDGAAGKAGYAKGDVLVQGLTYESETRFKDGRRTLAYTGVCRTRSTKGAWSVADCRLQVTLPGQAGAAVLTANPAATLIAGEQSPWGVPPVLVSSEVKPKATLAGGPVPPPPVAKPAEPPQPPADPNQTWARRTMTPEELAAQDAGTARLNADINARNAAIEARNRKAEADYKAAQAAREAEINANKAAYARQMADYQARVAAQEAANAKARADWEAAVKACKAGDVSKCAQPAPK